MIDLHDHTAAGFGFSRDFTDGLAHAKKERASSDTHADISFDKGFLVRAVNLDVQCYP